MAAPGAKSALSQAGLFQGRADTYSPEEYVPGLVPPLTLGAVSDSLCEP